MIKVYKQTWKVFQSQSLRNWWHILLFYDHIMQENNYRLKLFCLNHIHNRFIEKFLYKKGGGPNVQNFLEFNNYNSRLYWKLDFLDLHSWDQFQNKLVHPPNFIVLTSWLEFVQDLNFSLGIQTKVHWSECIFYVFIGSTKLCSCVKPRVVV